MKIPNPCYNEITKTDCPKRHPGCGANCKDWADYVELRDAEYVKRHKENAEMRQRISNYKARKHQDRRKK